jgi:hypothetical protein
MNPTKFHRGEKCKVNKEIEDEKFIADKEVVISSIFTNPQNKTSYMITDIEDNSIFIGEHDLKKNRKKEKAW